MEKNQRSIIQTLSYSDIFDYPLTKSEIYKFLITQKISRSEFDHSFSRIPLSVVQKIGKYYFLSGREEIVNKRKKRLYPSKQKEKKARRIASLLSRIPTVQMIGLSGSVAMQNAEESDDIDLLIVALPKTLWLTRLITNLLFLLLRNKRTHGAKMVKDKICTNMFLTLNTLTVIPPKQNLYTAHEVVQMQLLTNKNNTYEKFITQNKWVRKYLPHAVRIPKQTAVQIRFSYTLLYSIDYIAYKLQYQYMKGKIKRETVKREVAMFHPRDRKGDIMKEYIKRYQRADHLFSKLKSNSNLASKTPYFEHKYFTPGS